MINKKLDVIGIEGDEIRKHLLIDGQNYCISSYCLNDGLYVYDDALFEQLINVRAEELLEIFENVEMTYHICDEVWLDFELNPYGFNFPGKEKEPRSSITLRYDPEEWNKPWSIKEHFALFREKLTFIQGVDLYCDAHDANELTGEPVYNLLNGFGIGIRRHDNSLTVGQIYYNIKSFLESVNSQVIDEMIDKNTPEVMERCIEFPPEYHQAGVGILSFFSTYLNQQYPNENATVKIEQEGLNVRMLIEPSSGKIEVVEKALYEYEAVLSGQDPIEKYSNDDKLILELRNELRVAKYRIESQQDIIGIQNGRIDRLLDIVSIGLGKSNQTSIDFKPVIKVTNHVSIEPSISLSIGSVEELIDLLPNESDQLEELNRLKDLLLQIESSNTPEAVRRSAAMSKFSRWLTRGLEQGSQLNATLKNLQSGWEVFGDLLRHYNNLAEWCGMPIIPSKILNNI